MLDMRHIKVRGEEYVILKKDTLEDVVRTAMALTAMFDRDMLVGGLGFDVHSVTVEDEMEFWSQACSEYHNIKESLLEVL